GFELFELAEEVLDQVSPFINLSVDLDGMLALGALRDDDPRSAFVDFLKDPVCVKGLVGKDRVETYPFDQGRHANRIVTLAGQEVKPYKVSKGIGQGEDLGCPAAFRFPDRLILSPPFAPCPWR